MNKTERAVINAVINRLRGHLKASADIQEKLADPRLRLYLETWVVPALVLLLKEDRDLADLTLALKLAS